MPEPLAPNKGSKKQGFLFPQIDDSPKDSVIKSLEKNVLELNDQNKEFQVDNSFTIETSYFGSDKVVFNLIYFQNKPSPKQFTFLELK